MSKFEILGKNKLYGEIQVLGAKNAAMKMISASVLIQGKVTLENVPDILDIQTIIDILTENGAKISRKEHSLEIDTTNLKERDPNPSLVKKMRGSIVLVGPYLARFGKISFPHPGGCVIGSRPIDIHLKAFRDLGAEIEESDNFYLIKLNKFVSGEIDFRKVSVTATENILMASCVALGTTVITNAAREPEVVDLAHFLNQAGAKISGMGTSTITVTGVKKLHPLKYTVLPDRIEAGTFLTAGVVTDSCLKVASCNPDHLTAFLDVLKKINVELEIGSNYIKILDAKNLGSIDIKTAVYPGLATDLQAPMGLILTQSSGTSRIFETIFENRLGYLHELEKMGAKFKLIDPSQAEIYGPSKLNGAVIQTPDLRAGATLVLAALAAEGKTTILGAEIIDRGYENIEERLRLVGANIKRINR